MKEVEKDNQIPDDCTADVDGRVLYRFKVEVVAPSIEFRRILRLILQFYNKIHLRFQISFQETVCIL